MKEFRKSGDSITVNSFNPGFMAATNFSGGHADKARALVVKTTIRSQFWKTMAYLLENGLI